MTRAAAALLAAVALAACKPGEDGKLPLEIAPAHIDAVNGLVPVDWRPHVVFELGTVADTRGRPNETFRLALPRGWKPAYMTGSLQPGDADEFGRSAALGGAAISMRVTSNCNGECRPKDWAAEVDRVFYQKFTNGTAVGKVVKDDKQPTGRTLVFERAAGAEAGMPAEVNILVTWWKRGGNQHFICEAKLEAAAVALAPAFEAACARVSAE